jgi:hypothetical protein
MTDLPQLQTLLVDAAVRRRRRRRVRRVAVPALVAAVCLTAVPWVVGDLREADPEVPAVTPGPPPRVEDAFGVFRRPLTKEDESRVARPGDMVRYLGGNAFLETRGDQLCLAVGNRLECGRAADYVSGTRALAIVDDDVVYAVFPDRVKTVIRTWYARSTVELPVTGNIVTFTAPVGSGALAWQAPDGSHRRVKLRDLTNPRLWYHRLGQPESALDREAGYPEARFLIGDADGRIKSWLVPRRDAICLVARVAGDQRSVCRAPVSDIQKPLMLAFPSRPQRILILAFPSWMTPLGVSPERARRTIGEDAVLIVDGDEARTIRRRDTLGRTTAIELPTGSVLRRNDREVAPDQLP